MKRKMVAITLSILLVFSACGAAAEKSDEEQHGIPGRIVEETGGSYQYAGWWQLTDGSSDAPFVLIEIPKDNSSVVNCYDADGNLVDAGYTDYSEQRALNGNPLMVLVFDNLGQYAADKYVVADDNAYLSIWNKDQFEAELSYLGESVDPKSIAPQTEPPTVELAAKTTGKTTKTTTKRSNTLADYAGWWYHIPDSTFSLGDVFYVDSKAQTYFTADKYGNRNEGPLGASYQAKNGMLYLEAGGYSTADGYELYFGKDGDMNTLYFEDYYYSGEEIAAYTRGKAPVAPKVSMDGLPGKWYRDGVTKGSKMHVMELSKDGSYRLLNSAGKVEEKGNFALKMRVGRDGLDFISIEMGDTSGYVTDDKMLIAIYYEYETTKSAFGYSTGSHIYLPESKIGTQDAKDAVQRYQLPDLDLESTDGKNSLRFSRDGEVYNYIRNERGWAPEKVGTWTYKSGVLTIKWHSKYVDGAPKKLARVQKESCTVSDVTKGFTISSLGKIVQVGIE